MFTRQQIDFQNDCHESSLSQRRGSTSFNLNISFMMVENRVKTMEHVDLMRFVLIRAAF